MDTRSALPARATPSYDISLELLRREHPERYRLWVRLGAWAATIGYMASCVAIAPSTGWAGLWRTANPYIVVADLLALAFAYTGRPRVASCLVLLGVFIDMHISIAVDAGAHVVPGGMLAPAFVLGTGMLLGGRVALVASLVATVTVPTSMFLTLNAHPEARERLTDPLLLTTIVGILLTTGVLLFAFLRTFSQILFESRSNARQNRELIENAPDAIIALCADGRIEAFNRAAERALGVERHAILGRRHADLPLRAEAGDWPDDVRALGRQRGPIALAVEGSSTRLEALVRPTTRADGSEGTLLVLRDVTQRREAEARAKALSEQLQQAQKLEAIGLLAGGIAHDFNNLLTAIGGFGSLLVDAPDPKTRECARQIVQTQERGAALTRQLLAFARRDVAQPRPLDAATALGDLLVLVERLVGERIRVELRTLGRCPILADPGRFEQVVLNLAANARDAMPEGGTLSLGCSADDDDVTLTVADTGEGIAPEHQSRVFEPFFTTKETSRGTGLGLSTVHGIVTEAGGSIEIESEPGRGCRFVIRWPRSSVLPERPSTAPREPAPRGDGRSLILCEDHSATRSYVAQLLRSHGYRVEVARDGERALELAEARAQAPDLLLTDVAMPGISGPELASRLRERWPELLVLFMSGYAGDLAQEAGLDRSQDLVDKPFSGHALLSRIAAKLA